ncbi:MAG: alpha/beta fold hydrolase [Acidimicrobiales bacterium]
MLQAFDDGRLFGEAYGEGPLQVIWLHGWGRRGQDFARAAGQLAADGVASVALDLPGFGASPAPARAGGARAYADVVTAAWASTGAGPVVLVGHSFGGRVATVVAGAHPEVVRSLVLTGTPLVRRAPAVRSPWPYRARRALHARHLLSDRAMESARQRYGSRDYRAATGVMRDVLVATVNESYEEEMARVRVPVRLLWGADDTEVPVEVAERARAAFDAGATLAVLAGVAHFVPTEAPDQLAAAVREALG